MNFKRVIQWLLTGWMVAYALRLAFAATLQSWWHVNTWAWWLQPLAFFPMFMTFMMLWMIPTVKKFYARQDRPCGKLWKCRA